MGDIEARSFIVDRFEFVQTWMECVMYDPSDERHPDVILHTCGHPYLPFDARYQWAHVTVDVSFSRSLTGPSVDVGPTRSVAEFETTVGKIAEEAYNATCMGGEGYEYEFTIEGDCLPNWIIESDDVTSYMTVELTYDEELTKVEEDFTDEEIERRREEFRALFDDWNVEYGPDATPRP
ncbi:hypothetical protein HTG_14440 [Natrinema mahii]|nr:hypothetical protein HTG_14440 [Natrinema mahii]